jgi:hypothetical protein
MNAAKLPKKVIENTPIILYINYKLTLFEVKVKIMLCQIKYYILID